MRRLFCIVAILAACDDSSSPAEALSVEFVEPRSRAVLGCAADEDPGSPGTLETDVTLLVEGASTDLTIRLNVSPPVTPPLVRPVLETGIVRFDDVSLPQGAVSLVAELWRGNPPAPVGPQDGGVGGCVVNAGDCSNRCEHGIGVEGELCQSTANCACGLFCKAETQACAPYEGANAGCGCGGAPAGGGGGAQPLASANVGVTVETCSGLPIDAGTKDEGVSMDLGPGGPSDMVVQPDGPRPDGAEEQPDVSELQPDGTEPPPDMGEPDGRAPGMGQYGDECACGTDCASGWCVANKLRDTRTCTDECQNDNFCPSLDTCVELVVSPPTGQCPDPGPDGPMPGDMVSVCIPNETGLPCAGPRDCSLGICQQPPIPAPWVQVQSVCTVRCQDDRKCPHGYICRRDDNLGASVCTPEVEVFPCQNFEQCGGVCDPSNAETTVCIQRQQDGPNGGGYCSCTCASAADCPTGFACDAVGLMSGDLRRPGVCVLMAGYRCPSENEAVRLAQFPSMTCAFDPDAPREATCTAFCRNEADCPRNHLCQNVGQVNACLPAE